MDIEDENNLLGRWLEGRLTDEESEKFKKSEDYLAYNDIVNATNQFERPEFDVDLNFEAQKKYNSTYQEAVKKKGKVKRLAVWMYAAAAMILIFFCVKVFVNNGITESTQIAENKTIMLPDGSSVILNAKSKIWYSDDSFNKRRIVKLEGEAFFKVAKGSKFTVQTQKGNVTVLGTQFNVYDRESTFNVTCYEGLVSVEVGNHKKQVSAGQHIRLEEKLIYDKMPSELSQPSWLSGRSSFREIQLKALFTALEIQYGIRIKLNNIDLNRKYSGFFVHNNLEHALKTTLVPMNISYNFLDSKTVEVSDK